MNFLTFYIQFTHGIILEKIDYSSTNELNEYLNNKIVDACTLYFIKEHETEFREKLLPLSLPIKIKTIAYIFKLCEEVVIEGDRKALDKFKKSCENFNQNSKENYIFKDDMIMIDTKNVLKYEKFLLCCSLQNLISKNYADLINFVFTSEFYENINSENINFCREFIQTKPIIYLYNSKLVYLDKYTLTLPEFYILGIYFFLLQC